jgi:hypothetical protein
MNKKPHFKITWSYPLFGQNYCLIPKNNEAILLSRNLCITTNYLYIIDLNVLYYLPKKHR